MADPRDLASVPDGLGANDELHVPLAPRRGLSLRAPPWYRRLRDQHRLVASFCYSDHRLLRWDAHPGRAEDWVSRLAPAAALTLDVPWYGFMSRPQRARALARSLAAIDRGTRRYGRAGTLAIPLIKGLRPTDWIPQLAYAADLGLRRVAFYSRECLLERDEGCLRSFLKQCRHLGLRALLVGVFARRPAADGGYDAAASYHYVLARRGCLLDRTGRAVRLDGPAYSSMLGRFVEPHDARRLSDHNFRRARELVARPAPLTTFGFQVA